MYLYLKILLESIFAFISLFINYLLSFTRLNTSTNVKHIHWSPQLYKINYTYSKEEYDRKYRDLQQNNVSSLFNYSNFVF